MDEAYSRLLDLIRRSDREVLDPRWVEDELFAIKMTGAAPGMLRLLDSGKKYFNHDNSSVAYLIGITDYAPSGPAVAIKSARIEPPDIDIDFQHDRRDEVKSYLSERWKNVSGISVYTRFSSKNLVRDLARALAINQIDINIVCRQFDDIETFMTSEDTKWFRKKYPEITHLVSLFEGRWRQYGLHAAGVVISDVPLSDIAPIESRSQAGSDGRVPCVAYDMNDCLKLGLIKIDILALDILSAIADCLAAIRERHGVDIDFSRIPLDDEKTLNAFSEGHTMGVFQAEAAPLTSLMQKLRVESFNDIVLSTALVRPGALLTVADECVRRKNGLTKIPKDHPLIEEITRDTYNLFVYQEQLVEALVKIGGFSWPQADKVRKIIGKKQDPELFTLYEGQWMSAASQVLGERRANKLWKDFEKFAGYAFNKAHATAYGILMYRCMWLKVHYPAEYMFALLKNEDNRYKLAMYMRECKRLGVRLMLPDINDSAPAFSLTPDGAIMPGLGSINGVGRAAVDEIISKRPFSSMDDFMERVSKRRCNAKVFNALRDAGAFSRFGVPAGDDSVLHELIGMPPSSDFDDFPFDIEPLAASDDGGAHISILYVQDVKLFSDRARATIVDNVYIDSSPRTMYVDTPIPPKQGAIIIALIVSGRIVGFSDYYEYLYKIENGIELDQFEKVVLHKDVFSDTELELRRHGLGGIDDEKSLVMPISVKVIKTRNGDDMAKVVITDGQKIVDTLMFPRLYSSVSRYIQRFVPFCAKLTRTRDGAITYEDGGVISTDAFKRLKGLS